MQSRCEVATAFHLMQLCDSALPVGGFSFSCALESAVAQGTVHDVVTLEAYASVVVRQTLLSDGVAALHAFRNCENGKELRRADEELYVRKLSREWRTMSCRMGRKLAELGAGLISRPSLLVLRDDILSARTFGCHAVVQGALFAACGVSEQELFSAVGYGAATMVTGAAMRLMRVSHQESQRILFALGRRVEGCYAEVAGWRLDDMQSFAPQMEILSSLHERGRQRMFMS